MAKYCSRINPLIRKVVGVQPQTWRAMCKIKHQVEDNIIWQIGQADIVTGMTGGPGEGALYRLLPDDVIPNNIMLNEVHVNNTWQWNRAGYRVPWEVKVAVQHIIVNFTQSKKDKATWVPNTEGSFTISSAWNLLRKRAEDNWHDRRTCHKNVSLKINFHFWRMIKDRLSIDNKIGRFKIHGPSICCCCTNHKVETVEHLFGQSELAQELWSNICHPLGIKVQGIPLRRILVNCWNIQARNLVANKLSNNYAKKCIKITKWYPPPPNHIKLNSDGSCRGDYCGGGGLIRNDKGKMISAYNISLGKGTSNWAEAKALQYRLKWCISRGWNNIMLEADSLHLVQAIQGKIKSP
ncbi:uncharacterized protein LOC132053715 [Lycium ferocissimum]|uniref:uncharacterized protein LOC132053715 n=1 Tax=Lycium ferocissimum TaxID=112874 RepID=UPI0028169563|nr:uncharacterized protein LOC132053715 [Lycium ferocissimum]